MTRPSTAIAAAASIVLSGCGGFETHVPVLGPPADVAALLGHWEGEFESSITHRNGILEFNLEAQRDTAHGAAYLIPDYSRAGGAAHEGDRYVDPYPEVLAIEFLEVMGTEVRGRLAPYRDPETGERVETVFRGSLDGDVIRGTYVVQFLESGDRASGRWEARRKSG